MISHLELDEVTKDMAVTKNLGGGSLAGVPIMRNNGENYGTLCALDTRPVTFTDKDIELLTTMADLLGYVIDLDSANERVQSLSVPIVPIFPGVVVLPIIGEFDQLRAERILEVALAEAHDSSLDYFILDLSGLHQFDDSSAVHLFQIIQSLRLIGSEPVLTGVRPDLAMEAVKQDTDFKGLTVKSNLADALKALGFTLQKNKYPSQSLESRATQ
ncbi:STAS domain-containing protein [Bacillus sp. FJAT-44742]|uniref:STAS domain-containing protein n=1 Tax=Bacillus sp. FJAT-44742 TaxID=2014005 RepID=UPI002FCCE1E9